MLDSHQTPLPDLVVVPTTAGPADERRVELWEDHAGRRVLFCYSEVDLLHRLYRPDCPWARLDLGEVAAVRDHVDRVVLDVQPTVGPPPAVPPGPAPVLPAQRRA